MIERKFIEGLGNIIADTDLHVDIIGNEIVITDDSNLRVLTIRRNVRFGVNTNYLHWDTLDFDLREALSDLVMEYLTSPLSHRQAVEVFKFQLRAPFARDSFINYAVEQDDWLISNDTHTERFNVHFTQGEIDDFPDVIKELAGICDKVYVGTELPMN